MESPNGTSRIGLSVQEASRILGVSRNTVRRWCASGRLRSDRVGRPQGDAIRVFLDAVSADDAPVQDVPGDVPGDVLTQVPPTSRQDVPDAPDRAQAMAMYNRELIEPLVAALERSQVRVGELERENGRLEAENRALLARTEARAVTPTMRPLYSRLRTWVPWLLLAAILLLAFAAGQPAWAR